MRVRCPTCEAGYEIGETLIGPGGRWVRCAACGNVWHVAPPPEPVPPPEASAPVEEPAPEAAPVPEEAVLPASDTFAFAREGAESPPPGPVPEAPPLPEPPRAADVAGAIPRRPVPEKPPAAPAEEEPVPPPAAAPPTPAGVWVGWVVTIVVLGAAVWAALHFRVEIMAAWPPSEWVYDALGLGKPPG